MNTHAARGTGLLVLGMHRSGTSATAGALQRLGVRLGDRLVPAAADNPGGYFEHADAVAANERLLDALDRSWDDVRALPAGWEQTPAAADALARIRDETLAGLAGPGAWALKDPRLCRLLPLWRAALDAADARAACLLVLRHPDEVAASLQARDGMPSTVSHVLWLRHVLEAAAASSDWARAIVSYDRLLARPAQVLADAGAAVGLDLLHGDADALRDFVRPGARHHAVPADVRARDDWHAFALEVHAALEGDAPWAQVPALVGRFDALLARHADWIDTVGATLRAADVRRRALASQAIATEARLQHALGEVTALSHARLDALHAMRAQLDATQAAQADAEALSLQRLDEAARLHTALAEAEALSLQRLDDAARLDAALARTQAEAHVRLADAERLDRQLAQTQAGLAAAEAQAHAHLAQAQALDRQLAETQGALARVEALAVARQQEMELLGARALQAEERLARMEATWAWRVAQRVRRLFGRPTDGPGS